MVHTKSAIAFTVLALGAASTLARPSYDYSDELALREFEELVEDLAARGIDYDEYDARDFEMEDVDARDFEDYEIRELIEEFDVDARELDFGDFEEREFFDVEEDMMFERAASTTTSSSSSSSTPSATTTTIVTKPTGIFGRVKKERKTVLVTTFKTPKKCKRPGLFSRIKSAFNAKAKKRSQLRAQKSSSTTSGTATSTSATSTSSSTSASATATASSTSTANWSQITPPPRKDRGKGVTYSQRKKVGKDKVTTISRTVTAAPTPCPTKDAKKHKRDLDEFESVFEREMSFDELD
jgi:hypothetical protein